MLGKFIRQRREILGLSLRATATKLDVDPAYLSRVEAEKVPPSEQLVRRLSEILQVGEDELLLLSGRLPDEIRAMVEREPAQAAATLKIIAEMVSAEADKSYGKPIFVGQGSRAIEDGFPFEEISEIAEVESWRKEVYRPIYHVHKWWAQRLGSVFRAAIIGAASSKGSSVMDLFYERICLPGIVVYDPFMGSGTTIGEAHKLGCTVIGRDINPVAYRSVRVSLSNIDRQQLNSMFRKLASEVGAKIKELYSSTDSNGHQCDVLYFFWVKVLDCPKCNAQVDLFSNYVFAKHAYTKRNPVAQVLCPGCGNVISSRFDETWLTCNQCNLGFNPQDGPAKRTKAQCPECSHEFPIAKTARKKSQPPDHRLYAKLVLRQDGTKEYLPITEDDLSAFESAREKMRKDDPPLPRVTIQDGYNTRQILNYGYRYWDELFNERQLLVLTMLAHAIQNLPEGPEREALAVLFSGVLEFNNMFASYKGEGTGAVRHMFSHHILKPERTPIEANLWGTPKSSGAFSTLFKSRLLRALDYQQAPFEIAVDYSGKRKKGRKVVGIAPQMGSSIIDAFPKDGLASGTIYLSCGDSSATDIPDKSVDLVVTDPPFFDNVHYSELADFFYVWQQLYFGNSSDNEQTTRQDGEVQDTNAEAFSDKLGQVFLECHRVLRDEGLLVFSYHHSREDGWTSVARSIMKSGFTIVQSQPVKAEMSVAAPKSQAKEPIDLDIFLVCRKLITDHRNRREPEDALEIANESAKTKVFRFNKVGRKLSRNDVRIVLLGQVLVELSAGRNAEELESELNKVLPDTRDVLENIWDSQSVTNQKKPVVQQPEPSQFDFLSTEITGGKEA